MKQTTSSQPSEENGNRLSSIVDTVSKVAALVCGVLILFDTVVLILIRWDSQFTFEHDQIKLV